LSPCVDVAMIRGEECQFSYINFGEFVVVTKGKKKIDFNSISNVTKILTRVLDNSI